MADEINYLMTANVDGIDTYSDEDAILARVAEWLATPRGSVWGAPKWGNRLAEFRHEPMNATTAAAIENSIATDITADISGLFLTSIKADEYSIDVWKITIWINGGTSSLTEEVSL